MNDGQATSHSGPHEPRPSGGGRFLAPGRVRLSADQSGRVRLTLLDDCSFLDVKAVRAFPFTLPDGYVGLLNALDGDAVIGLVAQPGKLDAGSRDVLEKALAGHYLLPTVTKVLDIREDFGAVYFEVDTTIGRRQFVAKGLRDAIEYLGSGQVLIPDIDGNRYRVADWRRLDRRSRYLLEHVI